MYNDRQDRLSQILDQFERPDDRWSLLELSQRTGIQPKLLEAMIYTLISIGRLRRIYTTSNPRCWGCALAESCGLAESSKPIFSLAYDPS